VNRWKCSWHYVIDSLDAEKKFLCVICRNSEQHGRARKNEKYDNGSSAFYFTCDGYIWDLSTKSRSNIICIHTRDTNSNDEWFFKIKRNREKVLSCSYHSQTTHSCLKYNSTLTHCCCHDNKTYFRSLITFSLARNIFSEMWWFWVNGRALKREVAMANEEKSLWNFYIVVVYLQRTSQRSYFSYFREYKKLRAKAWRLHVTIIYLSVKWNFMKLFFCMLKL
jgi:hypothetical protein